jgi:hypothetical protein
MSRRHIAQLRAVQPGYRIADYFRAFPYRDPALTKWIRDIFLKLGLPN